MENTTTLKKKKGFFQTMAEFFFAIYVITLYLFVDRSETVIISQIAFIIFAGLTVLVILQKQRIHFGKNVMIVYLAFTWMFATYFWAQNEYVAYIMIKTMWQLFFLFFLVYNLFYDEENAHEYIVKCLYIAGVSLLGYSIYTYGLSEVIEMMTLSANSHARLGRAINQENTFGMMNAMTFMLAFYYMFYNKKHRLFHIAILSVSFLFAMASGSRKALLMVCIGVIYLIYKKYGIRQLYKIIAFTTVAIIIFMVIIQLPMLEFMRDRMDGAMHALKGDGLGDRSSNIRMDMIKSGWQIYKDRIIHGFGANNYRIVSSYRTYSHNNFIEILVDFGLVGFLLYYLIYWYAFRNIIKIHDDSGKALLCLFIVRTLMEMVMVTYYNKVHWILMAFLLIAQKKTEKKDECGEETLCKI